MTRHIQWRKSLLDTNSKWLLKFTESSDKDLDRLEVFIKKKIIKFFNVHVLPRDNPRIYGKALKGQWAGCWGYRVAHYRVITRIEYGELTILAIKIGHRSDVYDD